MNLEFEKKLVEESVFIFLEQEYKEGRRDRFVHFRSMWDRAYQIQDADERENKFNQISLETFNKLGLGSKVFLALKKFPIISKTVNTVFVRLTKKKKNEGADLYQKEKSHSILVQTGLERFLDDKKWSDFLGENLTRIEDVLDPEFGYKPVDFADSKLGARATIIRERYHLLWLRNVRARRSDARTSRMGHEELFKEASDWGRNREGEALSADCSLCRFPTTDWAKTISEKVASAICLDFPFWKERDLVCNQCFEIYSSQQKGYYVEFPGATRPA